MEAGADPQRNKDVRIRAIVLEVGFAGALLQLGVAAFVGFAGDAFSLQIAEQWRIRLFEADRIESKRAQSPVKVTMPGGTLTISWAPGEPIRMRGAATYVFKGEIDLEGFSNGHGA